METIVTITFNNNLDTIKECKSIERFTKISKIIDEKNTK